MFSTLPPDWQAGSFPGLGLGGTCPFLGAKGKCILGAALHFRANISKARGKEQWSLQDSLLGSSLFQVPSSWEGASPNAACFPFCFAVDEEDEYECMSVLNSHTQDVKHVVWHPNQEVSGWLCGLGGNMALLVLLWKAPVSSLQLGGHLLA